MVLDQVDVVDIAARDRAGLEENEWDIVWSVEERGEAFDLIAEGVVPAAAAWSPVRGDSHGTHGR